MSIMIDDRNHPDLAEAVRRLVEEFHPDRIYLFGSQARGEAQRDSDFDILVIVPHSSHGYLDRLRIAFRQLRDLQLPIQVLVFTSDEFERDLQVVASLPARVAREGEVLYAA